MTRDEIFGLGWWDLGKTMNQVFGFSTYTPESIDEFHQMVIPEIERWGFMGVFSKIVFEMASDMPFDGRANLSDIAFVIKSPADTLCKAALLAVKESEEGK
jgi:hypothetical protein